MLGYTLKDNFLLILRIQQNIGNRVGEGDQGFIFVVVADLAARKKTTCIRDPRMCQNTLLPSECFWNVATVEYKSGAVDFVQQSVTSCSVIMFDVLVLLGES